MSAYHIGILGAGAVGHMLAFFLQNCPGLTFELIGRGGVISLASSVMWRGETHKLRHTHDHRTLDLLFVCLKAYDLEAGLGAVLPKLREGTTVILLPNGYLEPIVGPLRTAYPHLQWRKGIVTRGIRRDEAGRYLIGAEGQVVWGGEGGPSELERLVCQHLAVHGFQWSQQSCQLRRDKWYFNTVLNTLCAVYQLPRNGDALRLFEADLRALAEETLRLGCHLWPDWQAEQEELWWRLRALIQKTADNENSMARDRRLGRQTEAEVLSGCLKELEGDSSSFPLLRDFHKRITGLAL